MASQVLLDTNVLIDYLCGQKEAITYLDALTEERLISTITVAELYAGIRDGDERDRMDQFIMAFELVPIDSEVAIKGGLYRRDYGPSHGTGLADAFIAASAEIRGATLVTKNERHFPMVRQLHVPYGKN